jgi:hypothetical protein
MPIKCGCQRAFIAKQPYLDQNLCQYLIYLNVEHKNKEGQVCHRKDVVGYWHVICSQLSNGIYEGSHNGVIKARPIPNSSNYSSQNTCYKDGIEK